MKHISLKLFAAALAGCLSVLPAQAEEVPAEAAESGEMTERKVGLQPIDIYAWTSFGRIMHCSDTSDNNFSDNWLENILAMFEQNWDFNERLRCTAGLGVMLYFPTMGKPDPSNAGQMRRRGRPSRAETERDTDAGDRGVTAVPTGSAHETA